mgnify:CR=1 FL=1
MLINMKKILILLFSLLISFNSYGEWIRITENIDGDTYYIDKDSIRENDGYVYYWELTNYLIPNSTGTLSDKTYKQGDCKINRYKYLSFLFYKEPMGNGISDPQDGIPDWKYPSPGSIGGVVLNYVCDYLV